MKTHKISIRKDITNEFRFCTLDKECIFVDPTEKYESITALTEEGEKTLIFIEGEWREVANIDFE